MFCNPWLNRVLCTFLFALLSNIAVWAIPPTISIQGSLAGTDGKALVGVRVWRVQFYDDETGGNALGSAFNGVFLAEASGRFAIELTPPAEVLAAPGAVWYELAVDSAASPDASINPGDIFPKRVAVHSVLFTQRAAHALSAQTADTATTAAIALNSELASIALRADLATTATYAVTAGSVNTAKQADTATTATVALSARTLDGVPAGNLATDAELASGLATKSNLAHTHNLNDLGGTVTDAQVPDTITVNHAASANTATTASFAITADVAQTAAKAASSDTATTATFAATATTAYRLQGETFLTILTTSSPTINASNLLAAYAAAKIRTPHGQPLSASNRITVIVPPGQYDLGTGALRLDTEFVDLEGLLKDREKQHLYGTSNGLNTGVLTQTVNNVRIENLFVECTRATGALIQDSTDPAAYFPNTALTDTVVRNCRFESDNTNAWSMRIGIEYKGAYEESAGGNCAFGGNYGTASGTFTNCTGGNYAFGGYYGLANGRFSRCTGLYGAFGGVGTASGVFTDCIATVASFGCWNKASGTFTNCTGAQYAFGCWGAASGTFTNCTGGQYAFGGLGGAASGIFNNCLVDNAYYQGEAALTVCVTTTATLNAANLIEAYDRAKTLTPHGQPLSASNRVGVILPPGQYDFGTGALRLDTEFVDVEGLSQDRDKQYLYGTSNGPNTGVLMQTANNVRIENLFVECTRPTFGVITNNTDPAAYFPSAALAATVVRNCRFLARLNYAWSMRIGIEYKGTYENSTGTDSAFGGWGGTASGTFINCTGGSWAFGGWGGTASGTFKDCTGDDYTFGGHGGTASGTFTNCKGDFSAFGGQGTASGTFTNCTGDDYAFGGYNGTASGYFKSCIGDTYSFAGDRGTAPGGKFEYCNGGANSFITNAGGGTAPIFLYCIKSNMVYP